jgi:phenylalanyl-tRNA synthetase alpha chain
MQDTFYLKDPSKGKLPPIYKKIKQVHENGADTGSKGWQSPWSEDKAKELLLRTHTTVLSAQTIAKLKKSDLPAKFFSVGKVFRNETLNWKHLFEFYQVEGIVVDPNANFRHLIGYLREFYRKMGYKDVRIRPAHFPYTEPSCEVDVLHPTKNEWIELGGAGIFRPEVVKPLLGFECPVLAWGQGMERIISEFYNITDIRELYKNDLEQLKKTRVWWKQILNGEKCLQ